MPSVVAAATSRLPKLGLAAAGVVAVALLGVAIVAGSRLALGVLWGFVPCTLVYGMLPLALFAGGAWQGAAVMLVFGAGTLPHLLGAGVLLARVDLRGPRLRRGAAIVIGAFALLGLYRAAFVPEALGHGAFCLF